MSNSKPMQTLPPYIFEILCYLNRDQLEQISIACRSLKNFIDRYFYSQPYRVFNLLKIRGGSYALYHHWVCWHPNRNDYSVQQFLAGQSCIDHILTHSENDRAHYSFAEMRPYFRPTVRINITKIYVARDYIYNPEHIDEMESIAYLWRDGKVNISNGRILRSQMVADDFQPILYTF